MPATINKGTPPWAIRPFDEPLELRDITPKPGAAAYQCVVIYGATYEYAAGCAIYWVAPRWLKSF